jgi:hypothetical protein
VPENDAKPIQFIPWDLNEAFGGFGMGMTPQMQAQLSLTHPHAGENRLIERLMATPRFKERYFRIVGELSGGAFATAAMTTRIDAIAKLTTDAQAEEKQAGIAVGPPNRGGPGGPGMNGGPGGGGPGGARGPGGMMAGGPRIKPDLKTFVAERNVSIADQLAGRSTGQAPTNMRMPGGGGAGGRGGGFGGPPPARD